jgi:FAD:protein FMN transferase
MQNFELEPDMPPTGVYRCPHAAMATKLEIIVVHPDGKYARQAALEAFGLVDRLELELSRFVENSDIARINHLAAGQSVRVGAWTMECLQIARQVYEETGGAFDIALGSGFEKLELIPHDCIVRAHADAVLIDLGGIGKGYAVDRIAEVLAAWDISRALIHAGCSSVRAADPPFHLSGWPLTLSMPGPEVQPILVRLEARNQALSGSGIEKADHITDPLQGRPVRLRRAAWVSAPCEALVEFCRRAESAERVPIAASPAAVADALSTAFMILPPRQIDELCRTHPGLEVWILEPPSVGAESAASLQHFPAA